MAIEGAFGGSCRCVARICCVLDIALYGIIATMFVCIEVACAIVEEMRWIAICRFTIAIDASGLRTAENFFWRAYIAASSAVVCVGCEYGAVFGVI